MFEEEADAPEPSEAPDEAPTTEVLIAAAVSAAVAAVAKTPTGLATNKIKMSQYILFRYHLA